MKLDADLLAHLAKGKPGGKALGTRWVIIVCDSNGRTERVYVDAEIEYYPNPVWPTHVVVWTPSTVAVIDHRFCDCIYQPKS